ncbi:MAG TPA: galactose-1-phosphate uridylyltransferase [Candidatus Binatia bacterium]|nr:galactose-1-phosphate uridylyltransferase [Candidatus Binatia bacterium]
MPELRKDPIVGRWVIIATERVRRPSDFPRRAAPPAPRACPFCPGHEEQTPPEVLAVRDAGAPADGPGWRVRVVPNKFPALRVEGALERRGHGLYDLMNGVGAHEVVVESPDHDRSLAQLPDEALADVLRAYRSRILDLQRDDRFRAVLVFKNHGAEAGATLTHPHSQLIATPVIPITVADELHGARSYHDYRERCLFCDIVRQESDERVRIVAETQSMVAFAPFAARVPYETWLLSRRHAAAFEQLDDEELAALATLLRTVLAKLDRALGDPPYNLVLHSAPFGAGESPSYHWHFELLPKLVALAGFELGTGFHINPVPPEDAARVLRDTRTD